MENKASKDGKKNINQQRKAVAVQYSPGMGAPAVVAKGVGTIADKIIEKGAAADVKLYRDEALVEELSRIDLGNNIPPELYEVVAQVLIFVSDLDKMQGYRKTYERKK